MKFKDLHKGFTVEGKPVIDAFKLKDQVGLPEEIISMECMDRGIVPDFYSYIQSAKKAGWAEHTIRSGVRELASAFPFKDSEEFSNRVNAALELLTI